MYGAVDFYNAAVAAGIKPVVGMEGYLSARRMADRDAKLDRRSTHLLMLAEDMTGYRNLLSLASVAQLEGFYYYPRVDHEALAAHAKGLIVTSGCMSAELPRRIQAGDFDEARRLISWYIDVFGRDNYYLELQSHDIPELLAQNKSIISFAKEFGLKLIATNDVHYVEKGDAELQDVLLAVQTGKTLQDTDRMRMQGNTYYMRSEEEMLRLFSEVPEAIHNTVEIAERCNVDLSRKKYLIPDFPVPEGYTPESHLRELCEEGVKHRYGDRCCSEEVRSRLEYELKVIHQMGFDSYFLIVWDICKYASSKNIWYNARGSAAGSLVAYSLFITSVDPLAFGLYFERFLNPDRISMPDIDLDFQDDLRYQLLEYCVRKYGQDKVSQIITFGSMAARASIRDVGRAMAIPLPEVDKIAKMIPATPGNPVTIQEALVQISDLAKVYN
jgi:DNA polymerase-3 subunit alpha